MRRLLFRFSVVYVSLYVLLTQMLATLIVPGAFDLDLGTLPPTRQVVQWTATHLFRATSPLVVTGSGSGDKTFDWVESFCLFVLAAIVASIWSILDRRRRDHTALDTWFRLFLRFALGSTMFAYGFSKAVPLQMSYPGLSRLVEPYGNFSPMGVLWASIGAAPAYEIFTGLAEIVGGLLVMIPRTTLLGALVCLIDTIAVFALNMTYDVPVKLFSFHLILFSLFLIAPEAGRLGNVFLRNAPAAPSTQPPLFHSLRANRIAVAAQLLVIVYLTGMNVRSVGQGWWEFGGGAPKSPLYGIWTVERVTADGQVRPPLATDPSRWRRIVFQSLRTPVVVQQMDDRFVYFRAAVDAAGGTVELSRPDNPKWHARFTYERASADRLVLDGTMDDLAIHADLQRVDPSTFLLVTRGFHWIQEYPFNR